MDTTEIVTALRVLMISSLVGICIAGNHVTQHRKTDKKILILGAGMSGASAASTLNEMGYTNFLILEGGSQVGGRVRHEKLGAYTVNMGPIWTRGEGNNPMENMLHLYNISHVWSMLEDYVALDTDGNDRSSDLDMLEQNFVVAVDIAHETGKKAREENRPDFSLRSALLKGGWMPSTPLQRTLEYMEYDIKFGQRPDAISGKYGFHIERHMDHDAEDDINVVTDPRGMTYIVETLLEEPLQGSNDKLQLNKVVTKIEHTDEHVTVTTTNGEVFTGDYVIVTFSIGVLQHKTVEFIPPLPEWKMDAIQQFQMSLYTHVYLQFDEYFWDENSFLLYVKDTDRYRAWTNFNIYYNDSNILMVTVLGDDSTIIEHMSETDVIDDVLQTLRDMYAPLGVTIPSPVDYAISKFTHDALFYGAFSSWPPGFTEDSYKALQARVGRVYFAGDYGSFIHHGSLNGAYYSGNQTGNDVMRCIQADGQCGGDYVPLYKSRGCMYSAASNYKATSREDDRSCLIYCSAASVLFPCYMLTFEFVAAVLIMNVGRIM